MRKNKVAFHFEVLTLFVGQPLCRSSDSLANRIGQYRSDRACTLQALWENSKGCCVIRDALAVGPCEPGEIRVTPGALRPTAEVFRQSSEPGTFAAGGKAVDFDTQMLQGCEVDVVSVVRPVELNVLTMLKATASDNHGVILHAMRTFFSIDTQRTGDQTNRLIQ